MPTQEQYGHISRKKQKSPWRWAAIIVPAVWGLAVAFWFSWKATGGRPLAVLHWPASLWGQPAVQHLLDRATLVFAGPLLFCGILLAAASRNMKGRDDLHGSARWAVYRDIKEIGYLSGEGVYVGGWFDKKSKQHLYLRHNGPEHILCFAPTRSGKGVGLILPTLLAWEHSSVVLDIKGENFALTTGYLSSQGHKTLRFDPSDHLGRSASFNPLEEIRLDGERAIADIQQIANMVLDPDGKGLTDYWNKAAFGFFGGVLLHCLIKTRHDLSRTASLYDVSVMLEDPERAGGPKALFEEILDTDHAGMLQKIYPELSPEFGQAAHVFAASAASGMLAKADKEMAGVVSTATSNLALYRDPVVAKNISACDFRISDLMNHDLPVNLYLVISPADIDRLRPLLRIFMTQLLGRLTEKMEFADGAGKAAYKHRLLLMLDEFTSLGKLPIVERGIAYMAGYGIKGYFIVQDTKQLNSAYGQYNALMANCHVRIAYAPNLPETAEYLSKLTGTTTVVIKKTSVSGGKSGGSRSTSISETSRPLLTPDECLRLPGAQKDASGKVTAPGDMLIFTAGQSPIYGRQILYFLDPVFQARAKVEAPLCSDSLSRTIEPTRQQPEEQPIPELEMVSDIKADYEAYLKM
ncbi:MAG: type IV secretory system conjugative DNA transfer family protein [Desulfocapsaceae bacterium]|nr:type IV secretory system conjugative DNA transfer family protein [Desulfocapsaceae bacterium]